MRYNNSTDSDILQDGKKPWRPKKVRSLILADSFQRLGQGRKASRVRFCGQQLTFAVNRDTGEKRLHDANFCRERLCPMCGWRRSLKIFYQVSQVMDKIQQDYDYIPVFLTLTLRNVSSGDLSLTLDKIFSGWHLFVNYRSLRCVLRGWYRALEVTYNKQDDTFHPHIHAILLFPSDYFKSGCYLKTVDVVQLWRKALKLDYDPICDIRKVRGRKRKAVAECAKYTLKDTDYLFSDNHELTDHVVSVLSSALRNRRLYAYGGCMKEVSACLRQDELGDGDLIHCDDTIRSDVGQALITYRWHMGISNYIEVKEDS